MTPVELCAGGPRLSPVVAGVWRLAAWGWTPQQRLHWIEQCMALGVTSFDHADIYGGYAAQALFGEALALAPALRERMQLVGKVGIQLVSPERPGHRIKHYDTGAAHILASVDRSLAELRTDRLDLLLIHRPDPLLDADEVAGAFETLRAAGKVLHFGVSNFTPAQFELLHARVPLATNQIELHPLQRAPLTDGTLDQCQRLRVRPMIWSPLAGGALLTSEDVAARRVRAALESIGQRHGVAPATVAFAWLLRLPSRPVPVAGSRRIEALREAVAALALRLDVQEWTELWEAAAGREVP
ncbi:MAG TPA: aldo/keto reductase [Albitalea sp.]|nr:aldo/keto reductase [Albitalea sp.]